MAKVRKRAEFVVGKIKITFNIEQQDYGYSKEEVALKNYCCKKAHWLSTAWLLCNNDSLQRTGLLLAPASVSRSTSSLWRRLKRKLKEGNTFTHLYWGEESHKVSWERILHHHTYTRLELAEEKYSSHRDTYWIFTENKVKVAVQTEQRANITWG